jgi:12-hydroxyjasmonoyl-L-amino acid 12-hydroxylase / fatty acid hydroxylase
VHGNSVLCLGFLLGGARRRAPARAPAAVVTANLGDWYAHLLRASPTDTVHVHVLGCVVTANPANVEYILKTNFDNFPKGKPFATILGDLLGGGIFNVDGAAWRRQRKVANLELDSIAVRSDMYQITAEEVETRLVPILADAVSQIAPLDLWARRQRS